MARLGRYVLPDQPLHVIQRGNNAVGKQRNHLAY